MLCLLIPEELVEIITNKRTLNLKDKRAVNTCIHEINRIHDQDRRVHAYINYIIGSNQLRI